MRKARGAAEHKIGRVLFWALGGAGEAPSFRLTALRSAAIVIVDEQNRFQACKEE